MDREEILNELNEIQYELNKVKNKLDNLFLRNKQKVVDQYELENVGVRLQKSINEISETIEIEKWVLKN